MRKATTALFFFGVSMCMGCSNMQRKETPDLYPNEKLVHGGDAKARAAQSYCQSLADEYVQEPDRFKEAMKGGAKGAVVGAGTGAIGGVIMKESVGRATGAGAAIGGIIGILSSLQETGTHSPSYQRFVERCMSKEGYEVVGWSVKS